MNSVLLCDFLYNGNSTYSKVFCLYQHPSGEFLNPMLENSLTHYQALMLHHLRRKQNKKFWSTVTRVLAQWQHFLMVTAMVLHEFCTILWRRRWIWNLCIPFTSREHMARRYEWRSRDLSGLQWIYVFALGIFGVGPNSTHVFHVQWTQTSGPMLNCSSVVPGIEQNRAKFFAYKLFILKLVAWSSRAHMQ